MITTRDKQVIISIGKHKVLTREQIQYLYFPSYQTAQRRIREEYIPKGYISQPFYIDVSKRGSRMPVYRLERKGKEKYREYTGKKYYTPRWNINYLPHLIELNWVLITLNAENFKLEYRKGAVQMDAYFQNTAIELDHSESETKSEIQRQYENYEKLYMKSDVLDTLVYVSNRRFKLYNWIKEIAISDLEIKFCERNEDSINKLRKKLMLLHPIK